METVFVTLLLFATCYCATNFSERARNFSIELLHYTQLETDGHVVISPFGVWSLLTGVSLGVTENSQAELTRAVLLPKNPTAIVKGYKNLTKIICKSKKNGVTMVSKNLMFLDNGFNIMPDFRKTMTEDFGANIQNLDFKDSNAAANIANNIIRNTGATVTNVLRPTDFTDSRMILTNVITFKGSWNMPFNTRNTVIEPFYDENNNKVGNVNMMNQLGYFPHANFPEIQSFALELPYSDESKYSMLILLPYPKIKPSEVYVKLPTITIPKIFERLRKSLEATNLSKTDVKLPRIKISTNVVLNKLLNNMGVYDIFEPSRASFKHVTNEKIHVSAIVHTANIEVNESGAAASSVAPSTLMQQQKIDGIPCFYANRPFIYFVMEKSTATVIYSGFYSKPTIY